jgi:hypothetical protein
LTVNEITNEEIIASLAEMRRWNGTPAGKLFADFERAIGRAWQTDSRESASDAAMKRDWDAADGARAAIKAEIVRLQAAEVVPQP